MSRRDPSETAILLPDEITWFSPASAPPRTVAQANVYGDPDTKGHYLVLMKWYPGFFSSPHLYDTDRVCVVVSGTWWCNSGRDFDPQNAEPVYAGGYVLRRAGTPHYDGVPATGSDPAVIAVSGMGPVNGRLVDPGLPPYRPG